LQFEELHDAASEDKDDAADRGMQYSFTAMGKKHRRCALHWRSCGKIAVAASPPLLAAALITFPLLHEPDRPPAGSGKSPTSPPASTAS
jgi:hypothetical protein